MCAIFDSNEIDKEFVARTLQEKICNPQSQYRWIPMSGRELIYGGEGEALFNGKELVLQYEEAKEK